MKMLGRSWGAAVACFLVGLVWAVGMARGDSMVVQPDGKIVLTGETWPNFAALARLEPDGALDGSFGEGGFVVDRRLPVLTALALQPDRRIVAVGLGGYQLSRYLPNGAPDPQFAGGGIGGTIDPEQPDFLYPYKGPTSLLVRPSGEIVVAGSQDVGDSRGSTTRAMVRRYDGSGRLLETMGRAPLRAGTAIVESHWNDVLEQGDGSLVGVGGISGGISHGGERVMLGRFVPGSGADYDASFGGGAGLLQPQFPSRDLHRTDGRAIAASDQGLLIAGQSAGTFLLARLHPDGTLDSGFGKDGSLVPRFSWTADGDALRLGESKADSLAVTPDGDIVVGGGTSIWSEWAASHAWGPYCVDCPQPLLARFDSSGRLDPGFGEGGVLHLLAPDGSKLRGSAEEVAALADGKLLVKGTGAETSSGRDTPFVARLDPDGSYDPSFGNGGLAVITFPCLERSYKQLERESCLPTIDVEMQLEGMRGKRPTLSLRLRPREDWARLGRVKLTMPYMLRPRAGFRSRTRVITLEGAVSKGKVHARRAKNGHLQRYLFFERLGLAREMRVEFPAGSLEIFGRRPRARKLPFQLNVQIVHDGESKLAGERELRLFAG